MQKTLDSQRKPAGTTQPQDERKSVRKRTFTRWMNVFLQKCDPPLEVSDLFTDIQDGRILMALLEELSGCKLLYRFRSSSHRIFRLNNISKALAFLDDRHVKLLDIDASSIADGVPSAVLNLVWNVILHFQVKEVTGGLQRHLSSSLSSLSLSTYSSTGDLSPLPKDYDSYSFNSLPRKGRKTLRESKYHSKAINTLLQWVQSCTSKYGVDVDDFGTSWRSGLAFLALIKSINPDLVDLRESLSKEPKENVKQAFMVAHHSLGVPPLLMPKDVLCTSPDEQSIITYVSMFLEHHSADDEGFTADLDASEIPNTGLLEPVSFGKPLVDDPEAQALLKSFEKSNEQLLWRRWSRRFSGTSCASSCNTDRSVSSEPSSSSPRRAFPPPSPLDACVVNQEIRSWVEKGLDRGCRMKRVAESLVSLSSEEGIYSLSALDSDEEDAYSYILDLNKDVFQPYNQLKRQVPKVEEETVEELKEEFKHLEGFGLFNGSRNTQEKTRVDEDTDANLKPDTGSQSVGHRKLHLDKNKSSIRETTNNRAVLDFDPQDKKRTKDLEEERAERTPNNDEKEKDKKMKAGCQKTQSEAEQKTAAEEARWQKNAEEQGGGKISDVSERMRSVRRLEEWKDQRKGDVEEEETGSEKRANSERTLRVRAKRDENTDGREVAIKNEEMMEDHVMKTSNSGPAWKNRKPEVRRHKDLSAADLKKKVDDNQDGESRTCRRSSDGGLSLQCVAVSCDVTGLELEVLLVLWILLYCCLILPQTLL